MSNLRSFRRKLAKSPIIIEQQKADLQKKIKEYAKKQTLLGGIGPNFAEILELIDEEQKKNITIDKKPVDKVDGKV